MNDVELQGLTFPDLPEGWTPLEGILLAKCLDENGEARWCSVMTDGLTDQEMLGALDVEHAVRKRDFLSALDEEDEGD